MFEIISIFIYSLFMRCILIFVFLISLLNQGCASKAWVRPVKYEQKTHAFMDEKIPDGGTLIVELEANKTAFNNCDYAIFIEDRLAGRISHNSSQKFYVPSGQREIYTSLDPYGSTFCRGELSLQATT